MTNEEWRTDLKKSEWICVLNDDETYTGLNGSWIAPIPDDLTEQREDIENGYAPKVVPVYFDMRKMLEFAINHGYFDEQKLNEAGFSCSTTYPS